MTERKTWFKEQEIRDVVGYETRNGGSIPVSEIFSAYQGEGHFAGTPVVFLRTGGCDYSCSWIIEEHEPIMLSDMTTKPANEVTIGDEIVGIQRNTKKNGYKRGKQSYTERTVGKYKTGVVEHVQKDYMQLYKVWFDDGRSVTVGPEHYFVSERNTMKKVTNLKTGDRLRAWEKWEKQEQTHDWKVGYLTGVCDGDGCFTTQKRFQLVAGNKHQMMERFKSILNEFDISFTERLHESGGDFAAKEFLPCIGVSINAMHDKLKDITELRYNTEDYYRGYFAGIYDTDGSTDGASIRIHQAKKNIREYIETCLAYLKLNYHVTDKTYTIRGGISTYRKLLLETMPAESRKTHPLFFAGHGIRDGVSVARVEKIARGGVVAIQTSLGTYLDGNGILHRNCDSLYAVDARKYALNWSWQDAQGIAKVIRKIDPHNHIRWLTLTGGNPAMHKGQARFELLDDLKVLTGKYFAIETQGTMFPNWHVLMDHVTLSPKPPSSGNTTAIDHPALEDWVAASERFNDDVGQYYYENDICLKIVIADKEDLAYAASVHKKWPEIPLYLQPMTPQTIKRGLTDRLVSDTIQLQKWVLESGDFNLAFTKVMPQIHAILHGIGRGF